jgi:hypothetical protein
MKLVTIAEYPIGALRIGMTVQSIWSRRHGTIVSVDKRRGLVSVQWPNTKTKLEKQIAFDGTAILDIDWGSGIDILPWE